MDASFCPSCGASVESADNFCRKCGVAMCAAVPAVRQPMTPAVWQPRVSPVMKGAAVMAAGEARITRAHLSDDFIDDAERAVRVQRADTPQPPVAALAQAGADDAASAGSATTTLEALELQTIRRALEETKIDSLGTARVDSVHLYKSDLKPTGSVYTRLFSAPLKK